MATDAETSATIRPTKKQRELLTFIEQFIGEHGYSPSYREIMNGLDYTSVATVSLHVNSLICRGHLRKRDRSARSLEVVKDAGTGAAETSVSESDTQSPAAADTLSGPKWLIARVEEHFSKAEAAGETTEEAIEELYILLAALRAIGLTDVAENLLPRIGALSERAV